MCRFVAYLGQPIALSELLFEPNNSLVHQSLDPQESVLHVNGDGFGVGWYNLELSVEPGLFKSMAPAWSDLNLRYMAAKIYSHSFLGHIRAASAGGTGFSNCHPFHYERFLFMHNGNIGGFQKIKRHIRHKLSDPVYDWVKGQTDSEHFSALFLQNFIQDKGEYNVRDFASCFRKTLNQLNELREEFGVTEPAFLNFVVSDGHSLLISRYVSDPENEEARSLYYALGGSLSVDEGVCHFGASKVAKMALVVSERLDAHDADWVKVPQNNLLLISDDIEVELQPI